MVTSHVGDFEVMVHHMSLLARANQRLTVEKQKLTRQNLELNAKVLEQGQLINKLAEKQRIMTGVGRTVHFKQKDPYTIRVFFM